MTSELTEEELAGAVITLVRIIKRQDRQIAGLLKHKTGLESIGVTNDGREIYSTDQVRALHESGEFSRYRETLLEAAREGRILALEATENGLEGCRIGKETKGEENERNGSET